MVSSRLYRKVTVDFNDSRIEWLYKVGKSKRAKVRKPLRFLKKSSCTEDLVVHIDKRRSYKTLLKTKGKAHKAEIREDIDNSLR